MGRIYRYLPADGYEWIVPTTDSDYRILRRLEWPPPTAAWRPIAVRSVGATAQGELLRRADLPWLTSNVPACRPSAWEALRNLLASDAEPLTLAGTGGPGEYLALNVRVLSGAIDLAASTVERFPSGRLLEIKEPVLVASRIEGAEIFRLAELPSGPTFVSEAFVHLIADVGLSGLAVQEVIA